MIYIIFLIKQKIQQRMNKGKKLLHNLKNYVPVFKILKNPKIKRTQADVQVRLWLKNCCLKMNIYTSQLLNPSVEAMNSIVEDIIDL